MKILQYTNSRIWSANIYYFNTHILFNRSISTISNPLIIKGQKVLTCKRQS